MKNKKCIIGATILTPIVLTLIVGALCGIALLAKLIADNYVLVWKVIVVLGVAVGTTAILGLIWMELYKHCKEFHERKKVK